MKTMSDVSKEYGGALFDLSCEEKIEYDILCQLRVVDKVLRDNPDYVKFLASPNIPRAERIEAVEAAFGGKVHQYVNSFLKISSCPITLASTFRSIVHPFLHVHGYKYAWNNIHNCPHTSNRNGRSHLHRFLR